MPLLAGNTAPVHLVLSKDRVKTLKSGHPWVYAESIQTKPPAASGSLALIKTKDGDIIAKVKLYAYLFYDHTGQRLNCISMCMVQTNGPLLELAQLSQ